MPQNTVEFWFDFASTYSYVSACRIDELAGPSGIRVKWMPFLLGPIFKAQGWDTSPFNIYPAKGLYMWRDMERLCDLHALPLKRPAVFPQFALLPTRVALAAEGENWQPAFCKAVFQAEYGRGEDIASAASISALLEGLDIAPADWIEKAGSPAVKQALKDRGDAALEKGIFGAPSFLTAGGELFWGDDRLEQALEWVLKRR